jgi:hypothetical protein
MELYQSLKLNLLANKAVQKVAVDLLSSLSLAMPGIYDPSFGILALLLATKKYILFASLQQHVKESNSCDQVVKTPISLLSAMRKVYWKVFDSWLWHQSWCPQQDLGRIRMGVYEPS